MNAILRLNAETYGYNKEFTNTEELQKAIALELDENVYEISIKKRAAKSNSQGDFTKEKNIKEINILGVVYTIEEVEVVNKSEPRRGEINFLTNEIRIDKNMPQSLKEQVLMHEILHATFDLLGFSELAEDEEKVQSIATALHQILTTQTIFSS